MLPTCVTTIHKTKMVAEVARRHGDVNLRKSYSEIERSFSTM
jgi:hypothetical protein